MEEQNKELKETIEEINNIAKKALKSNNNQVMAEALNNIVGITSGPPISEIAKDFGVTTKELLQYAQESVRAPENEQK